MTNVQQRVLTAAVVVPILLVVFYLGGLWLLALVEFVIFVGMSEFYKMMQAKGFKPQRIQGTALALALGALAYLKNPEYMLLALTIGSLVILASQLGNAEINQAISSTATTVLGAVYVGLLVAHIVLLRNWQGEKGGVDLGLFFIVLVIAVTFLSDTGGFFIGRKWGRHKMSPVISPKKSWEGAGGSVVFGTAASVLTKMTPVAI